MRLLAFLLAGTLTASAGPKITVEKVVRYENEVNGKPVEIIITQGFYDFKKHKIAGGNNNSKEPATVDGTPLLGSDGLSPFENNSKPGRIETIQQIQLTWEGLKIPVPASLHINLLNLTLSSDSEWRSFSFTPTKDRTAVIFQALGGDGGATYMVSLVLRQNGKHLQFRDDYWEDQLPSKPDVSRILQSKKSNR